MSEFQVTRWHQIPSMVVARVAEELETKFSEKYLQTILDELGEK